MLSVHSAHVRTCKVQFIIFKIMYITTYSLWRRWVVYSSYNASFLSHTNAWCRFDKRITAFAEDKFKRDGIDVKTGSMVVKVSDKEISTKQVKNGEGVSTMPYGMVVWSTGIGTRPVIMDFMKQVGQV